MFSAGSTGSRAGFSPTCPRHSLPCTGHMLEGLPDSCSQGRLHWTFRRFSQRRSSWLSPKRVPRCEAIGPTTGNSAEQSLFGSSLPATDQGLLIDLVLFETCHTWAHPLAAAARLSSSHVPEVRLPTPCFATCRPAGTCKSPIIVASDLTWHSQVTAQELRPPSVSRCIYEAQQLAHLEASASSAIQYAVLQES